MVAFWILATVMTLVALAFVLVPLLRGRAASGPSSVEANLEVLRAQRREIEADVANGTLPAERARRGAGRAGAPRRGRPRAGAGGGRGSARQALGHGARQRAPHPGARVRHVHRHRQSRGHPPARGDRRRRASPWATSRSSPWSRISPARCASAPTTLQGWGLLARSMASLGRFEESAAAYAHLAKIAPGDADVLADYADVLGMAQGRNLMGRPFELARQALAIEPGHPKALAIAGTAALDSGDYAGATGYWQALAAGLPPESADAAQVNSILAEIRERAREAGQRLPQAPAQMAQAPGQPAQAPAQPPVMAANGSVTGSVSLSPAVAGRVSGTETLFIFARAEGGPRVPLAVVRATASELPMTFALDDSQAMAPGMNLSSASEVRIEARVSRSGNASPQPATSSAPARWSGPVRAT
jgi:cytochrome c-type biogenesis protein CcmH